MLNIYQRSGESVHPWPSMSWVLWAEHMHTEKGQYLIVIFDEEECAEFITLKGCPPVFISLRRSADGLHDEVVLGVPDEIAGESAEQLAAAQIENALAAVESIKPKDRERIVSSYGLKLTGVPGAGPRALRAQAGPVGKIQVSIFYEGLRDDYTLNKKCTAMAFITETETVALSTLPELYAASLFSASADVWKKFSEKAQEDLCAEFGIDMETFLRKNRIDL